MNSGMNDLVLEMVSADQVVRTAIRRFAPIMIRKKIAIHYEECQERQAKKLVQATDERRAAYHKYYTGETWGMAENYDLCLNVSKLGTAGTIAMIEQYIRQTGLE